MNSPTLHCDDDSLRNLLDASLAERDEALVESHLNACIRCRDRLEELAGDGLSCGDASRFFVDDELDNESPASVRLQNPNAARPFANIKLSDEVVSEGSSDVNSVDGVVDVSVVAVLDRLGPTDDPNMLGRFGGYEIVGAVGCGGMGVVLKGFERSLNRHVAIKVLAPHLAISGSARKRFAREGQAAASVIHPNVVAIHQVSEANGFPFLVMPYLGSRSLQKRIVEQGPLKVAAVLRIGLQVAQGLSAAHAQGLIHRDIKPANILLESDVERVVITDFGLARTADEASLTKTGVLAGTPQYMSPEQARGEAIDQRSDLFSLGSVLYTLCTGRPPFRAETSYGILRRITDDEPRPIREINPDVPAWLCSIVERLHAKDREQRYQTAEEVGELLEQCLAHVQQPLAVPLPDSLTSKPRFSLRTAILLAIVASLAVALCSVFLNQKSSFVEPARPVDKSPTVIHQETLHDTSVEENNDVEPPHNSTVGDVTERDIAEMEAIFDDLQRLKNRLSDVDKLLHDDSRNPRSENTPAPKESSP